MANIGSIDIAIIKLTVRLKGGVYGQVHARASGAKGMARAMIVTALSSRLWQVYVFQAICRAGEANRNAEGRR